MASAKQIKNQKLFAKRVKRGDFRKAISKTKKRSSGQINDYQSGEGLEKKLRKYGIKKANSTQLQKGRRYWSNLSPQQKFNIAKTYRMPNPRYFATLSWTKIPPFEKQLIYDGSTRS